MENGYHNGIGEDHDKNYSSNRMNTAAVSLPTGSIDPPKPNFAVTNGATQISTELQYPHRSTNPDKMNDLPDPIEHETQGFVSVSSLLTRLAQRSHNELVDIIRNMARIQVTKQLPNGNSVPSYSPNLPNDDSRENLQKKSLLLNYASKQHENWVKTFIIMDWSRKYQDISKLVDLRAHMIKQTFAYSLLRDELVRNRGLFLDAKITSPDLKTALEVLSTGSFSGFPNLGFAPPRSLAVEQQIELLDELDTLLSLRLNIDDNDKIPYQFRDFIVHDGRVTFTLKDKFEVDLTITDEDFSKQYWFVDFRFLFTPCPSSWSLSSKSFLEQRVNDALRTDGLVGCYNILHEFVLTYQISEYRRQALGLLKQKWVGTLAVESLHRAAGIQYWVGRHKNRPKSWVVLGVERNRTRDLPSEPNETVFQAATSSLRARWFRDGQEVKDITFPLGSPRISTERLLRAVIAKHIEHILVTIQRKFIAKPRFASREAGLSLTISLEDPSQSALTVDLDREEKLVVRIDPITGFFALSPHNRITYRFEQRLNASPRDPADEGLMFIEQIRIHHLLDEIQRRGRSVGWESVAPPLKQDDLKQILNTRDQIQYAWFKRDGWDTNWHVMLSLGLAGDIWYLMEISERKRDSWGSSPIKSHLKLPVSAGYPNINDGFFNNLTTFVTGIMGHWSDLNELHSRRIGRLLYAAHSVPRSHHVRVPDIYVSLAQLLPELRKGKRKPWAHDWVIVEFRGIYRPEFGKLKNSATSRVTIMANAKLSIVDKTRLGNICEDVDKDVLFNRRKGVFSIRLHAEVGKSIVDVLTLKIQEIERLVEFAEVLNRGKCGIQCEEVSLRRIVFKYGCSTAVGSAAAANQASPQPGSVPGPHYAGNEVPRCKATLDLADPRRVILMLDENNPHLRVHDLLTRLVNSRTDIATLPGILSSTLSLYRSLDSFEDHWQNPAVAERFKLVILPRAIDWISMRIHLHSLRTPIRVHTIVVDFRLKARRNTLWWYIRQGDASFSSILAATSGGTIASKPTTDIERLMDHVWAKASQAKPAQIKKIGDGVVAKTEAVYHVLLTLHRRLRVVIAGDQQRMQTSQQHVNFQGDQMHAGPDRKSVV